MGRGAYLLALAVVIALGAYLRLHDLGGPSLWHDEIVHVQAAESLANQPLQSLIQRWSSLEFLQEAVVQVVVADKPPDMPSQHRVFGLSPGIEEPPGLPKRYEVIWTKVFAAGPTFRLPHSSEWTIGPANRWF